MDNETITIVQVLPSAKEQAKAAAIGLGISLAATVIIVGGLAAAGKASEFLNERRIRKQEKLAAKQ